MRIQGGTSRAIGWLSAGVRAGVVASILVPACVLATLVVPGLWAAYPLFLLPLLLAGPLAARGLPLRTALGAAAVAGVVSGFVATLSYALAWHLHGAWYWGLTGAASAAPMPSLPRIAVAPVTLLTWAHQDILVFQPLLAVLLGGLAWALRRPGRSLSRFATVLMPASLSGRLRLAFGAVVVAMKSTAPALL